jgi:hypothetical protein
MRLQHAKQAASGLLTDTPVRVQAKTVIVDEVARLRWRIWHGRAKNARLTLDRIRNVMHAFKGERSCRTMGLPSRKRPANVRDRIEITPCEASRHDFAGFVSFAIGALPAPVAKFLQRREGRATAYL